MKLSTSIAAALTAAAITAAPAAFADNHAEFDPAAEAAAIDEARTGFMDAISTGAMAELGALLHPQVIMVVPGGPEHLKMYEQAEQPPFPAGATIEITPTETVVINETWAYDFGTSIITYTPEGSSEPLELRDTYLMLLKKHDGKWKPYREVASATPPPGGWPDLNMVQ
ncbi:MAG TPA: nuclear transport factor 2 family protein [Sulfitobacter sp.]|nr:nuclear transport factor 2 family protein [Sulfitobacter sp.]